jgi:hypothetical protein
MSTPALATARLRLRPTSTELNGTAASEPVRYFLLDVTRHETTAEEVNERA